MSKFIDGPAAGVELQLRRAPILLRVVHSQAGWDALDQLHDEVRSGEKVYAYILTEPPTSMHLLTRGKNRHAGGWYAIGVYRLLDPQPTDAEMRDTELWMRWGNERKATLVPAWAKVEP